MFYYSLESMPTMLISF